MSTSIAYTEPDAVTALACDLAAPLSPSRSGYGGKIPTRYTLRYHGSRRRVYAMVYGNSASVYINHRGSILFLDTDTEHSFSQ